MMIAPMSPVLMSFTSSTCEWYIHITELPSMGPGPARAGTSHTYVYVEPGATASSRLSAAPVLSLYGTPSEFFS